MSTDSKLSLRERLITVLVGNTTIVRGDDAVNDARRIVSLADAIIIEMRRTGDPITDPDAVANVYENVSDRFSLSWPLRPEKLHDALKQERYDIINDGEIDLPPMPPDPDIDGQRK